LKICDKEIIFDDPWKVISAECKDFVKKLLTKNPKERINTKNALLHPWISQNLSVFFVVSKNKENK